MTSPFITYLVLIIGILPGMHSAFAQEQSCIKVQFIYGSKPAKAYRSSEKKWFGGKMGGHVGIEKDNNQFISFEGNDRFHPIDHIRKRHCKYCILDADAFWGIMGTPGDSVQKTTIIIPVSLRQKLFLDSLSAAYVQQPPYDYSVFGMRCASATYEILAQLGIEKSMNYRSTCLKILYPKRLRKKLLKQARKNGWAVIRQEGSARRIWERD